MQAKRFFQVSIITLIVFLAALVGVGFYMVDFALLPDHRGKKLPESWLYMEETYPGLKEWHDSIEQIGALKDTFIYYGDCKLHAYYLPADSAQATAVIVHGYTDNAIRMMMIGMMYNTQLHYNILLPDLQDHGLSEGNSIQMGWKDRLDVMQWIEVAHNIFNDSTLVLHGISMGSATVMMTCGEELPPYVKGAVADCGYSSVWDQFTVQLKDQFGLPAFPILDIASLITQYRFGWNFHEASPQKQIAKCKFPVFFIHGDADDFVPTYMVYDVYNAKTQGVKELWLAPGSEHALSYRDHTQEYTQRVKDFMNTYVLDRCTPSAEDPELDADIKP